MQRRTSGRSWRLLAGASLLLFFATYTPAADALPQPQRRLTTGRGVAVLEADQQRQERRMFYADGNVEIRYENFRLRADHAVYNDETKLAEVRGHVQFDHDTQHLDADEGSYDLRSGRGSFHHVHGTIAIQRRPNPSLLLSPNPLYFDAVEVDRVDERTYSARDAWITVCKADRPKWKFYAAKATIKLERTVELEGATFRFFSVPVIVLPFATVPASRRNRQSGFLIPDVGTSSRKGFTLFDAFYWAPADWLDTTAGLQLMSRRGWGQHLDLRAQPGENMRLEASYFAVEDRGLLDENGIRQPQGGHEFHLGLDALLPQGWRAVADLNELSSLTFRLAFSETFTQAVNSEVRNTAFFTNNFHGFSLDFAALSYKNFLSTSPETYVDLRTAPEARLSSVPQAPWKRWPIYFGFDVFADAVHRSDTVPPSFETPEAVQRSELAPNVTIPLHWGPWLGVTPSFTLRSTHYGAQLQNGQLLKQSVVRTTEEFSLDLRPPSLARIWERPESKWKHTIEPEVVYRYVTGVNQFSRFLRFDEDDTLTDTNEVEYAVTQRLYRKGDSGEAEELLSLRLAQKYFFDPTFGGALVPGQRNVFQTLDSLTPFAFADAARHFSPIIADLKITPGRRYDAQFRVDYDPQRGQPTAFGTLLKLRPYRESFVTLAHFSTLNLPAPASTSTGSLQPRSNQVRLLLGYGDLNRPGWNTAFGFSYDIAQQIFQNQVVQVTYNGSCCGIGFEFRRLDLGNVRVENQYRIVLLIANIGSAGNLRRQEKIF
jgi:LPS-assembly protein